MKPQTSHSMSEEEIFALIQRRTAPLRESPETGDAMTAEEMRIMRFADEMRRDAAEFRDLDLEIMARSREAHAEDAERHLAELRRRDIASRCDAVAASPDSMRAALIDIGIVFLVLAAIWLLAPLGRRLLEAAGLTG